MESDVVYIEVLVVCIAYYFVRLGGRLSLGA